jgi:hypothetical protein
MTDADVIMSYSEVSGYDPATGANDRGCNLLNVMNYWHNSGIGNARHKIDGFGKIDAGDLHMIKTGIFLCEGLIIGVMLPRNVAGKDVWVFTPGQGSGYGSWGGHCVYLVAYDSDWFTCVTWGKLLKINWRFLLQYCDEIFAPFSFEMFNSKGFAANGIEMNKLKEDIQNITQ